MMLSSSTIFTYRRFAVERELDTSLVVCRTGKVQQPFGCGTTPPQMDQPNVKLFFFLFIAYLFIAGRLVKFH